MLKCSKCGIPLISGLNDQHGLSQDKYGCKVNWCDRCWSDWWDTLLKQARAELKPKLIDVGKKEVRQKWQLTPL